MRPVLTILTYMMYLLPTSILVYAQTQTVGLFQNDPASYEGYTLFSPLLSRFTYLIDHNGLLVNSWRSDYPPGNSVYLLESGYLLRAADPGGNSVFVRGGDAGRVEKFDWEGNLLWEFNYSSDRYRHHHDVESLPNGNVLMVAWELKSMEESIAAGRDPSLLSDSLLWPEHVIEVEPLEVSGGNIVWEWHVWDHLIQDFDPGKANYGVVAEHPELVDINRTGSTPEADWLHINAVDYNAELDQIALSVPTLNELWVIDHSTTTEEAAGHTGGNSGKGGDILYRWGNPRIYRTGSEADQKLFFQHDVHWIDAGLPGGGNIMVFNNGSGRSDGDYTTICEIIPPIDSLGNYIRSPGSAYGPSEPLLIYIAENPFDFFAPIISGAQRMPNGNTLICHGPKGTFFEVTPDKEIVWLYVNPVTDTGPLAQGDTIPALPPRAFTNFTFRAYRYGSNYPGLAGRDLTATDPIERPPTAISEYVDKTPGHFILSQNYPNPFNPSTHIDIYLPKLAEVTLKIYNLLGQEVKTLLEGHQTPGTSSLEWNGRDDFGHPVASGIYVYKMVSGKFSESKKMILLR